MGFVVIEKGELRKLVKSILTNLRKTKPNTLFTLEEIATIIESKGGQKPAADEVKEVLREQRGSGIEPATIGGQVWQFGPGKPPISRQI